MDGITNWEGWPWWAIVLYFIGVMVWAWAVSRACERRRKRLLEEEDE